MLNRLKQFVRTPNNIGRLFFSGSHESMELFHSVSTVLHVHSHLRSRYFSPIDTPELRSLLGDGFVLCRPHFFPGTEQLLQAARDTLRKIDIAEWKSKSKKPFLMAQELSLEAYEAFAYSKEMIDLASSYLGTLPVVTPARLWYSPNEAYEAGRSQDYHVDGEDARQLKVFLFVEDVEENTGPFTAIPAAATKGVLSTYPKKSRWSVNVKISDADIESYMRTANTSGQAFMGKAGTVAFVDTSRCLHFGSRPQRTMTNKPRVLVALHYLRPYATCFPMFGSLAMPAVKTDERQMLLTGALR